MIETEFRNRVLEAEFIGLREAEFRVKVQGVGCTMVDAPERSRERERASVPLGGEGASHAVCPPCNANCQLLHPCQGQQHGGVRPFHRKSTCLYIINFGAARLCRLGRRVRRRRMRSADPATHTVNSFVLVMASHTVDYDSFVKSQLASTQSTL